MAGTTIVSVHHSYDAQRDDEIKLEKGEIITVTDSSDPDWWEGKKDDGSIGFFPSNFVEPVKSSPEEKKDTDVENDVKGEDSTAEPTETEAATEPAKSIGMARVMEDYAMQGPDELTLHRGGIATLYERLEDGWLKGEINGKVGKFPGECVEEIDMPGRPDLGTQSTGIPKAASESTEEGASSAEPSRPAFKLAAYGVKQGGIGSVLAGGFPSLKKTGGPKKSNESEPKPASPEKVIESTPPAQASKEEELVTKLEPEQALPADKFDQNQSPAPTPTEKFVAKAIVLHPYDAENEDELNLLRGEYVNILDKNVDDGWWKGTTERGQTGVFPSNFVKEIEEESIASPPPVRTRKSVTSTSSQQSFNTASSSRASAGITARAPPLPGNRPISTGNTSRPGSLHEQQPSSEVQSPSQPAIPEETTPLPPAAPAVTEVTSPVAASPDADKEIEEEKTAAKELESKVDPEEEKFSVQEAETKVGSVDENKEGATPVSSPPVPSRPPKTASRPTSEVSSLAEKSPLPVSRPTSEATSENIPTPPSRPTSEASSVTVPPPKPASRPSSQADHEKTVDSPTVASSPEQKGNTKKDEHKDEDEQVESKEEEEKTQSEEEQVESKEEENTQTEEKQVESKEEEKTQFEKAETAEKKEEQDNDTESLEVGEEEEEKKTFDMEPTGPKLSAPSRVRPTRARRSPQPAQEAHKEEPSQMDLLRKDLEQEPEESTQEVKRDSEEPTAAARSPPAKPVKPIFAKFPTPFGGAVPELKNLKPVQRRMWEPAPAHEFKESEKKDEEEERPRPTGVRNIASRFNVPSTGGGSNEVLETKLKNFTKNEVDKLRKELQEEREKRVQLEQLVASLAEQVEKLQQ